MDEIVDVGVMQDAGEYDEKWCDLGSYGIDLGSMEAQNMLGAYSQRVEEEHISFQEVLVDLFGEENAEEILTSTVSDPEVIPDYSLDEMDSGYLTTE